jgi:nucleotide-binding universal stress UspA family protein
MARIVAGYDGSPAALAALSWAAEEARLRGVALTVLTVLPDHHPALSDELSYDEAGVLDAVRSDVDRIAGGTDVELRPAYGYPASQLVRACSPDGLLVVGSRGRSTIAGLVLGSVSRSCLHTAPCPVVVVHPVVPTDPRRGRVIVGIDASPASRRALAVAATEARLRKADLLAVHAVHWDHFGAELVAPATRQLVDWGRRLVATELADNAVHARPVIVPGHAPDVLVRRSANADLLVLGSRGHNPFSILRLGSTADHCARYAHCPVMIVPDQPG